MRVRSRENLNSIYMILFLTAAFYLMQMQDATVVSGVRWVKYKQMFAFNADLVGHGEVWRLFTFQFLQGGHLSFFFALLILYIVGSALEQLWGTANFLIFYMTSVLGTVVVAWMLNLTLVGGSFLWYSLLFVYAYIFPEVVFYIFFVLPVKVKWLAWLGLASLALGLFGRDPGTIASIGGVVLSFGYFVYSERPGGLIPRKVPEAFRPAPEAESSSGQLGEENLETFEQAKKVVASDSGSDREALIKSLEPKVVPGVNICPSPADYKPEAEDRYCVHCEGFAECTIRFVKLQSGEEQEAEN